MKLKYVICPGMIDSKADGQQHYISSKQLMRLYDINPLECCIYDPKPWWPRSYYDTVQKRQQGLIRLMPRYDGKYIESKNAMNEADVS